MDIQLKIMEIANNLNITKKDKKDIDEYLDHNELAWLLKYYVFLLKEII